METDSTQTPKRSVLWFASGGMLLFTWFMYLFFDQRGWETRDVIFIAISGAMTSGLVLTLINAQRYWWGMRIVTFIIFACYLSYLLYEFWWSGRELELTARRSSATPFNAILGFLFFGVPSLLYTFWGSTWGKLGHAEPRNVTGWDLATFYLAWGAQWLFLILSGLAVVVALRS